MNDELIRELENTNVSEQVIIKTEDVCDKYWMYSRELIRRKIIRNWVLGEFAYRGEIFETRYLGNMDLMKDLDTNCIMNVVNNYNKRGCNYDRKLKKEIDKYLGIDQMVAEEGIKGTIYRHLPIFSRRVFYKYRRYFGSDNTYLDVRKIFGELVSNGTIVEQTEEYKYIETNIGTVKIFGDNYISYVSFNDDIVNEAREEVA